MGLGARITKLRLAKSESFQQVADAVGVSKAHIWELEKGRTENPSMNLLKGLADHFEVSISFLVGEDAEAADADAQLQRMFRQANTLEPHERKILDDMMQSLLLNRSRR